MVASRHLLRFLNSPALRQPLQRQSLTNAPRTLFQRSFQTTQRRGQTVAKDLNLGAGVASESAEPQSAFAKLWNSKVGPKTVHFWAPIMKWGIVLTGVADFARPAESLSLTQNAALMCTGAIWTRWCLIIKPKNVFLATVNFFLFCVGFVQVGRIVSYNQSVKDKPLSEEFKEVASEKVDVLKNAVKDPKGALEAATK